MWGLELEEDNHGAYLKNKDVTKEMMWFVGDEKIVSPGHLRSCTDGLALLSKSITKSHGCNVVGL